MIPYTQVMKFPDFLIGNISRKNCMVSLIFDMLRDMDEKK